MADRGTKPRGEKVDVLAISTEQRQMKGRSRHTPGGENNRWRVFKRHRFSLFGTPFFPIPFCRFCDSQPPILFFVCLPAAGLVLPCFHFFFFFTQAHLGVRMAEGPPATLTVAPCWTLFLCVYIHVSSERKCPSAWMYLRRYYVWILVKLTIYAHWRLLHQRTTFSQIIRDIRGIRSIPVKKCASKRTVRVSRLHIKTICPCVLRDWKCFIWAFEWHFIRRSPKMNCGVSNRSGEF